MIWFLTLSKDYNMPDISKCANKECPMKHDCYRFTAPSSDYQSYSSFKHDENGECKHFWNNKGNT